MASANNRATFGNRTYKPVPNQLPSEPVIPSDVGELAEKRTRVLFAGEFCVWFALLIVILAAGNWLYQMPSTLGFGGAIDVPKSLSGAFFGIDGLVSAYSLGDFARPPALIGLRGAILATFLIGLGAALRRRFIFAAGCATLLGVTGFFLQDLWAIQLLEVGAILFVIYFAVSTKKYHYSLAAVAIFLAFPTTAQLTSNQLQAKRTWLVQAAMTSEVRRVLFGALRRLERNKFYGDQQAGVYLKLQLAYLSRDPVSIRKHLSSLSGVNRTFSPYSQDRIRHIQLVAADNFKNLMPRVEALTFLGLTGLVTILLLAGFGLQFYASRLNSRLATVGKVLAKWSASAADEAKSIDDSVADLLAERARRFSVIAILACITGLAFITLGGKAPYYLFISDKGFNGIAASIAVLKQLPGIWIGHDETSKIIVAVNLAAGLMPFVMLFGVLCRKPRYILLPLLVFTVVAVGNRTSKTFEGWQVSLAKGEVSRSTLQRLSKAMEAKRIVRESGVPQLGVSRANTPQGDAELAEADHALMQLAYLLGDVDLSEKHYNYYAKSRERSSNQSNYRISRIHAWLHDNGRSTKPLLSDEAKQKLAFMRVRFAAFALLAFVSLLVSAFAFVFAWEMRSRVSRIREMSRRTGEAAAAQHVRQRRQRIVGAEETAKSRLAEV